MATMKSTPLQMLSLMLLIVMMSSWRHAEAYNNTCILPKQASGEPGRPVLADHFIVRVEVTILNRNRTVEVVEDFDFTHNRGHMRMTQDGIIADMYYDYITNQLLTVLPDLYTCQVQQLNTSDSVYLLGDNNGHIFSPAAALRFTTQGGSDQVYLGRSQVRGINVHQWRSCVDWPHRNTFMHLTWSFMDNMNWVASAAAGSVPVECHLTGKVFSENGSYRSFDHLYDFMHYTDSDFPPGTFETPSGVVCPGRQSTLPLPYLPGTMQFTGETVHEVEKTFTYTQEKYDAKSRIVIVTYLGPSAFTAKFGSDSLTVIHDFSTGTEYVMDIKRDNCTMSPLASDPDLAHIADPVTLRLRTTSDMLDLTGASYIYQAQRTVRGVPCNVWLAEKRGSNLLGLNINATFEWAFSEPGWRTLNEASGVSATPMQLIHTLEFGARQQTVTNVYDYVASVPDILQGVVVDSCFIGLPRNRAVFSISVEYRTLVQYFQQEFGHAVRRSVSDVVGISPVRVANVQFRIQQFTVDVWLDLLSVPPKRIQVLDPIKERSLDNTTQSLVTAVQSNLLVIELFKDSPRVSRRCSVLLFLSLRHLPPG